MYLGFSDPFGLSGHGQTILQFLGEIDIFDQDTFNFDAPGHSDFFNNLLNALSDFLTPFNDVLKDTGTEDVTESSLSTFHESSTHWSDPKCCLVGIDNVEVDDRGDMNIDIVFGHTHLSRDFEDCDFNVDLLQFLAHSARLEEI